MDGLLRQPLGQEAPPTSDDLGDARKGLAGLHPTLLRFQVFPQSFSGFLTQSCLGRPMGRYADCELPLQFLWLNAVFCFAPAGSGS